jgi:hypothetical protein
MLAVLAMGAAMASATAAQASVHIFSYEPTNDATRRTAGPLTFEFDQRLVFTKVLWVRSTEGRARADLKPANEAVLGRGGLSAVIGADAHERDLYEVEPSAEGADMIHAFCPGSTRAWLAFGRLAQYRDLRIDVLGDAPAGGKARVCATLDFSWRGEWTVPAGQPVRQRDLKVPTFPY